MGEHVTASLSREILLLKQGTDARLDGANSSLSTRFYALLPYEPRPHWIGLWKRATNDFRTLAKVGIYPRSCCGYGKDRGWRKGKERENRLEGGGRRIDLCNFCWSGVAELRVARRGYNADARCSFSSKQRISPPVGFIFRNTWRQNNARCTT